MSGNWITVAFEALVAVGFFSLLREITRRVVRRFWARPAANRDAALVIQGMSLKMLEPLEHQLEAANARAERLAVKLTEVESDLDVIVAWSREALAVLETHGLTVHMPTPATIRRLHQRSRRAE